MAEFHTWRNKQRHWLKDAVPLDMPYSMHITVSQICNLRCCYCSQSVNPGNELMTMETYNKIIAGIKEFPRKLSLLDLYGDGEPLCNPHFAEMVSLAKTNDVADKIGVTTNGLLFTKKRIDEIIDAGIDIIRISIQGINAETYKRVSGVDIDFEKFLETLAYLYKRKNQCKINIKIADIAINDIPNGDERFKAMFGDIADTIFIEHIIPLYRSVDYGDADSSIKKNAQNGRNGMVQTEMHKVCYRPFIKMLIRANGNVTSACTDPTTDVVYGNVHSDSLVDCWNGEKRRAFLKMQLEGKRFQRPECSDCIVPNDVAYEEDLLDPWADEILKRF